jgi:hypothetical protein
VPVNYLYSPINHLTLIGFVEKLWAKFGHHRKGKKVNILPFPHGESCSPLGDDMASRSRSNKLRNRHYSVLLERFARRTYYGKTTYYFRFARTQDTCRERCRGRVHDCFPRCYLSIYSAYLAIRFEDLPIVPPLGRVLHLFEIFIHLGLNQDA